MTLARNSLRFLPARGIAASLRRAAFPLLAAATMIAHPGGAFAQDGGVNRELKAFNEQFASPRLVNVAPGVHVAFAYSYSNFSFIEGKTGLILIDTGWFEPGLARALKDIKRISGKPISAIVITHNHEDHTGGGQLAVEAAVPNVPIYAVANFALQRSYDAGPTRLLIQKRNFAQTGLPLIKLGQKDVYASVGPIPEVGVRREVAPNQTISGVTELTVDGVRLRFIPGGADVGESMMVWMPDTGVLFSADAVGGVYPYIETPRYEPRRDPRVLVETLTTALSLKPKVVVSGHGRIVAGERDAQAVLAANREVVEYTLDQVERMLLAGRSSEQIVHDFRLPEHLRTNKDLQPYYHKVEWILRGLIVKRVGYFTDTLDLIRLDGVSEAERLVKLAGGRAAVLKAGRDALGAGDARWAARLARTLQNLNENDAEARALWERALEAIASRTDSANERNYALVEAGVARGAIDLDSEVRGGMEEGAKTLPTDTLLFAFKTRVRAETLTDGETHCLAVTVDSQPAGYFHVLGSVMRYERQPECSPTATLAMTRATLVSLYAQSSSWSQALAQGQITVTGSTQAATRLATLLD